MPAEKKKFCPGPGASGSYSPDGKTLFFTRLDRQGSSTKRYRGGTAENIWRFEPGTEAVLLTGDWSGTSNNPMAWTAAFISFRPRRRHEHLFDG